MITYDYINTLLTCILDLFIGLDTAVEGNDEFEPVLGRPIDAFICRARRKRDRDRLKVRSSRGSPRRSRRYHSDERTFF